MAAGAIALLLAACNQAEAPDAPGVCWQKDAGRWSVAAREVAAMDDCAAELEAIHLARGGAVEGAYQGVFIFADARAVSSAAHEGDFAYPIFQPTQRAVIDKDLRALIKEHGGAVPSAANISVQRQQ